MKIVPMETRIDRKFAELRAQGKKGFIAYICAGDPSLERTVSLVTALEQAGADVVELGLPFSDPLADGIVNQLAAQRALEAGATVQGVLDAVSEIRRTSQIPIVLYTYLNPLMQFGCSRFFSAAHDAGIDGILILDLPPEEDDFADSGGLQKIRLIAPTTPPERIREIASRAEGFVYYVSREGVTGEQTSVSSSIAAQVAEIRQHTPLPVAVGFGISNPSQAAEVAASADAVVVGSAIVKVIAAEGKSAALEEKLTEFVRPLSDAVHSVA
jgi:tryptophan synthase alpha chain